MPHHDQILYLLQNQFHLSVVQNDVKKSTLIVEDCVQTFSFFLYCNDGLL
jgi:hypothetical protein